MHSLRTKITLMTVIILIVTVFILMIFSVIFIQNNEHRKSDQLLLLLCETGEKNLDYYFNSTQKSVEKVASFAAADIDGLEEDQLASHVDRVRERFDEAANKTNGVLTYYYRIDPAVSDTVKGFWYTDLNKEGFEEHEVTDITKYDLEDTDQLVWFTVPKNSGEAIWLPPYITDNLDKRVISYNTPVYFKEQFVGVVGIEIDYTTMAEQVESIKLFNNGYAFLCDAEGTLFYHPRIDVTQMEEDTAPTVPKGALSESTFIRYHFEGEEKIGAWLPLNNRMRLYVTVPVSEAEGDWQSMILNIILVTTAVIVAASVFTMLYTKRIVKPLKQLTEAAKQVDRGNYEFSLDYDKNDEVGTLTKTFKSLSGHMKENIKDLNKRVFVDALTKVKNKGAFSVDMDDLQAETDREDARIQFAIGVFDCDDLKVINDRFGHDKGDEYLKAACRVICRTFRHSPVYRIGGDEFSVILRHKDYEHREKLIKQFEEAVSSINTSTENQWEQVHVSFGIATFDPQDDIAVNDVLRRADKNMYENKRVRKNAL